MVDVVGAVARLSRRAHLQLLDREPSLTVGYCAGLLLRATAQLAQSLRLYRSNYDLKIHIAFVPNSTGVAMCARPKHKLINDDSGTSKKHEHKHSTKTCSDTTANIN